MNRPIEIVDRGRGLQLVPYFQQGDSYDEIMRWIPTLTHEEIAVVERYCRAHEEELDEEDRRIREHTEEQVRLQRLRFPEPEGTPQERLARLRKRLEERRQEKWESCNDHLKQPRLNQPLASRRVASRYSSAMQ